MCGVTDNETALQIADLGVDAVGFVLSESPRQVGINSAAEMVASMTHLATTVAVMRHPSVEELDEVFNTIRPDFIQAEPHPQSPGPRDRYLPVFHDSKTVEAELDAYLYATESTIFHLEGPGRGGRGISVDLTRAVSISSNHRLVLAGGLTPENVADRIAIVRPWAVDVSSGVESSPGKKDMELIRRFIAAVRQADAQGDGN